MERSLVGTTLIIPSSWLSEVGDGAVLSSAAVVGFSRKPISFANGNAVGPGPLAFVTSVSGTDPLNTT